VSGALVHQSVAAEEVESRTFLTTGIYVVRQGSRSVKVRL
jgi:hypothetical protein